MLTRNSVYHVMKIRYLFLIMLLGLGSILVISRLCAGIPTTRAKVQQYLEISPVMKNYDDGQQICTSIYTVTNESTFIGTFLHDFYDSEQGGVIIYSFDDTISGSGDTIYDLAYITSIPDGYRGRAVISADVPSTITLASCPSVGPAPDAPALLPIDNANGDANYVVSWSSVSGATRYELQESDNPTFVAPTVVYIGSGTSWNASDKLPGTYYYRVRASNAGGYSSWSNVESATVILQSMVSVGDGDWNTPSTWDLNRIPTSSDIVMVQPGHTVTGPVSADVYALRNYGILQSRSGQPLQIQATSFISNYEKVLGSDGSVGTGSTCGGQGSNLELRGTPIYNEGTIQAGNGGDGDQCGGPGGSTMVFGRNTTNHGTICAGHGGDVLGTGSGQGGHGGDTHVRGNFGGPGSLINDRLLCAGDGGDGNTGATEPQSGGCGGTLYLLSIPVFLDGGQHYAGQEGQSTGGASANDCGGSVRIEPNIISLSGSGTRVRGKNVIIFGGDDWVLDLSNMDSGAISATNSITLAVGSGGAVDLSGNTDSVLHAGNQVVIASDIISLEAGIALPDVVGVNVITSSGQILLDFSLTGPGQVVGRPGATLPISFTLLNNGPATDTYTLSRSDSAGWNLGALPSPTMVGGLDLNDLALTVTLPSTAENGATDTITITATSLTNPNSAATTQVQVSVEALPIAVYLPLILKR